MAKDHLSAVGEPEDDRNASLSMATITQSPNKTVFKTKLLYSDTCVHTRKHHPYG